MIGGERSREIVLIPVVSPISPIPTPEPPFEGEPASFDEVISFDRVRFSGGFNFTQLKKNYLPIGIVGSGESPINPDLKRWLDLTNADRLDNCRDCDPMKVSAKLVAAAQFHADEIASLQRDNVSSFSSWPINGHDGLNGSKPWDRAKQFSFISNTYGENIFYQTPDPNYADAMFWWMKSPGHRANLLNKRFATVGIAWAKGERTGRYYWVQVFAGEDFNE